MYVRSILLSPDIVYEETSGDVAVLEGDNATLVCQATGHPRPRLMWKREDGAPILLRRSLREATPGQEMTEVVLATEGSKRFLF
ncbi:hypothetical protein LSTR_LSTR017425 [Laodelphax striatellus]|uniref:Ig-like domain-containing protein n=1 Tax=Laodelphax striatellus TaxID=195883 RepID=A0A482WKM3_LAOST|nr:hypothetical protein LSTR_LSTR017425 [Laodelphax striatellus]